MLRTRPAGHTGASGSTATRETVMMRSLPPAHHLHGARRSEGPGSTPPSLLLQHPRPARAACSKRESGGMLFLSCSTPVLLHGVGEKK